MRGSKDPFYKMTTIYGGYPFQFRVIDTNAIEEVFVDQEYGFIHEQVTSTFEPIVVDVGAHIGAFALWSIIKNQNAKIFSIEADPDTFKILSHNSGFANEKGVCWQVYNRAAWSSENESLSFSQTGPSMSHRVDPDGSILVPSITLAKLISLCAKNNQPIDVLKIDIEGSEEAFLCEYPEALSKVKCLVIELHPNLCNTERVIKTIDQYFTDVIEVKDRTSSKPLLYCQ